MREELAGAGRALPWVDPAAFARRAVAMALADREAAAALPAPVFFDRGVIDAAVALEAATGEPAIERLGAEHRFRRDVFLAPPWPEIRSLDPERRLGLDAALAEYERLARAWPALGYRVRLLPKVSVAERADFVLGVLGIGGP